MSPYTAIIRRSGNAFELAHVLVSWLLGGGFDAYVVVGCAVRDTCMGIRYRTECPEIPDENPVVEVEPEPEEQPRYKLVPLPDFSSKYVIMMAERKRKRQADAEKKLEDERNARIAELEKPPFDPINEWRTHAWVLIMAGPMGVQENMFIEPSEGVAYPLNSPKYHHIESIYNHENYYANLQLLRKKVEKKEVVEPKKDEKPLTEKEVLEKENKEKAKAEKEKRKKAKLEKERLEREKETGIKEEEPVEEEELTEDQNLSHLNYDLSNLRCWEHMLAGEPTSRRVLVGVDIQDKRTARDTEKHMDVPWSWIEKLDITASDFEQRYPGSHKVIHYKKVLLEKFAKYSERDGIIKRIKIFEDYALTIPILTYEYFSNREDKMMTRKFDHIKKEISETFLVGRSDHLIKHTYAMDTPATVVESTRTLEFNYYRRLDHLNKIVCTPLTFDEYYIDRTDRLSARNIIYSEGTKAEPKRKLKDVIETFLRNPDIPAKDDVWMKFFHVDESTIQILYHYGYNFISNDTRFYEKPNLAETGGKILFYPEKTSGYIADPCSEVPRPLDIYYTLCINIDCEYKTTKAIRDREIDVNGYLRQRYQELMEPELVVSLFNTERNLSAQKGYTEQEVQRVEMEEREKEAEIDPLAPYLARMFGSGHGTGQPLTLKEATLVREQCINDFRSKQLARQLMVQDRYEKLNTEYKNKRLWYLANQFILTQEKETAYFALSAELAFQVHTLEVRLTRHRDLSAPRFKALMDYLNKHPLLAEFNRFRSFKTNKGRAN